MKSAAPFVAIVCGVFVALVVGIAAFGDRIGLGHLSDGINDKLSMVTSLSFRPSLKRRLRLRPSQNPSLRPRKRLMGQLKKSLLKPRKHLILNQPLTSCVSNLMVVRLSPGALSLVGSSELKNGSAILSKAVANSSGEWVMVLNDPLGSGRIGSVSVSSGRRGAAKLLSPRAL